MPPTTCDKAFGKQLTRQSSHGCTCFEQMQMRSDDTLRRWGCTSFTSAPSRNGKVTSASGSIMCLPSFHVKTAADKHPAHLPSEGTRVVATNHSSTLGRCHVHRCLHGSDQRINACGQNIVSPKLVTVSSWEAMVLVGRQRCTFVQL